MHTSISMLLTILLSLMQSGAAASGGKSRPPTTLSKLEPVLEWARLSFEGVRHLEGGVGGLRHVDAILGAVRPHGGKVRMCIAVAVGVANVTTVSCQHSRSLCPCHVGEVGAIGRRWPLSGGRGARTSRASDLPC